MLTMPLKSCKLIVDILGLLLCARHSGYTAKAPKAVPAVTVGFCFVRMSQPMPMTAA